ncbi:uncharacterized protein HKW66_Vig0196350 [Vigna angularis]|uniref:MAR-binding filament-like protein 1 n=1 Tax=Phaseolus angularis TaxID=3914 RepID=A0A8T0KQB4_PHAAN|nr:uncharacterized protein HKW66_Vig0196350 [Vigna angularis]
MATLSSIISLSSLPPLRRHPSLSPFPHSLSLSFSRTKPRSPFLLIASSAHSSDDFTSKSKKSVLTEAIQEIEPLDVSHIQKDVPPATAAAMKRIISGMLGLLPSDQFHVVIEALWEPLSKLLISSMTTGYTLRNAEYRLFLEKNLEMFDIEKPKEETTKVDLQGLMHDSVNVIDFGRNRNLSSKVEKLREDVDIQDLGEISAEAQQYIFDLQSRLSSMKKELHEVKRKSAALQMQQFRGEEKNDLLNYLRSLKTEQVFPFSGISEAFGPAPLVAQLSEFSSPELKEIMLSVVHGLLATLSPKMHSKPSTMSEVGPKNVRSEDCAEVVENSALPFQPVISLTRDYLARLLFWCVLLGYYLRGLECRMELMDLLDK